MAIAKCISTVIRSMLKGRQMRINKEVQKYLEQHRKFS